MTTKEVANRLIELCNQGKWQEAQKELYADNCISIECPAGKDQQKAEGMKAIAAKGQEWGASIEQMHGMSIEDLIVTDNHFTFKQSIDATYKGSGRHKMQEISLFTVQDGKVVSEQFFY